MIKRTSLLFVLILIGLVQGVGWAQPSSQTEEDKAVNRRIRELGLAGATDSQQQLKERFDGHVELAQTVRDLYRDKNPERYARLTNQICGQIRGIALMNSRRDILAEEWALAALEKRDQISLDAQCDLALQIGHYKDAQYKKLPPEVCATKRTVHATILLETWKRIEDTIDPNWDPQDAAYFNLPPPPRGANIWPGSPPSAIKDPKLRAEYEAAIAANDRKRRENARQVMARHYQKFWIRDAESMLIGAYWQAPDPEGELETLLDKYGVNGERRAEILQGVRDKKIPDRLIPRTLTQPDR